MTAAEEEGQGEADLVGEDVSDRLEIQSRHPSSCLFKGGVEVCLSSVILLNFKSLQECVL